MKNNAFRQQLYHVTPLSCYEDAQSDSSIGVIFNILFYFMFVKNLLRP